MPVLSSHSQSARRRTPKLRHHKATGQGYVQLGARFVYLGRYDDPETLEKDHRTLAEWVAAGRQQPVPQEQLTVKELLARFWVWAVDYYVDGSDGSELCKYRRAARPLKQLYGESRAADFGPLALQTVRRHMIDLDWCRHSVNNMTNRVRNIFRRGKDRLPDLRHDPPGGAHRRESPTARKDRWAIFPSPISAAVSRWRRG